jgi:predicted RNase H-like HicB family nuclease
MKYLVIIEKGTDSFCAYVPDLPGCTSAGNSFADTLAGIREAIEGHLEVMREYGDPIPEPSSEPVFVDVPVAV